MLKKLLLALVIVALFVGVYFFMTQGSEDTSETVEVSEDVTVRTNQILADIQRIDSYKLDTSIFEDTRFTSLKNFHIDIPDVPAGRDNPFAPVQ